MAPTRERPGIVRVRISDREVWHVVDPSLTPAEAEEAVRAHRAANAPTNRSLVRRVLAWTPGVVVLAVLLGTVVSIVAILEELELTETPAEAAVIVTLSLIGIGVAATAGIVLLDPPWRHRELEAEPRTSRGVVAIDSAALRWVTDHTPAGAVWSVVQAVALVAELEAARWRLADALYGRLDGGDLDDDISDAGVGDGEIGDGETRDGETRDGEVGDDSADEPGGRHPAAVALRAARAAAEAELRHIGDEVGFDADGAIRSGEVEL